jgi:hypothetical protein
MGDPPKNEPWFEVTPFEDSSGWYVLAVWPDGRTILINGFASEAEAQAWITTDESREWLAERKGSTGA